MKNRLDVLGPGASSAKANLFTHQLLPVNLSALPPSSSSSSSPSSSSTSFWTRLRTFISASRCRGLHCSILPAQSIPRSWCGDGPPSDWPLSLSVCRKSMDSSHRGSSCGISHENHTFWPWHNDPRLRIWQFLTCILSTTLLTVVFRMANFADSYASFCSSRLISCRRAGKRTTDGVTTRLLLSPSVAATSTTVEHPYAQLFHLRVIPRPASCTFANFTFAEDIDGLLLGQGTEQHDLTSHNMLFLVQEQWTEREWEMPCILTRPRLTRQARRQHRQVALHRRDQTTPPTSRFMMLRCTAEISRLHPAAARKHQYVDRHF